MRIPSNRNHTAGHGRKDDDHAERNWHGATAEKEQPQGAARQRRQFGVPPNGNATFASVQHFIHHLTVDESKVLPEILDIHFKTSAVWKDLAAISTGTNLRRRLNPNAFLGYHFPLPPMEIQQHVKAIADRAATKRKLQTDAAALEKALLPSLLDRIFNS